MRCFIVLLLLAFVLKKKKLLIFKNIKENIWEKSEKPIELPEMITDSEIIIEEVNHNNIDSEETEEKIETDE